jgi:hypothetical protein
MDQVVVMVISKPLSSPQSPPDSASGIHTKWGVLLSVPLGAPLWSSF